MQLWAKSLATSKIRWLGWAGLMAVVALGWLLAVRPASATLTQTANGGAITINDGNASPYPSTANISGLLGRVTGVTVSFSNFSHARPNDVNILLVAPTGQTMLVMAGVGGNNPVSNINLTFDDAAPGVINNSSMASGTYKPSNLALNPSFPPNYTTGPFGSSFGVFGGINPNGAWNLYVVDAVSGATGTLGNWSITVTTTTADLELLPITANPSPAFAGGPLSYTLSVINNGGDPASNATITITLPANTTFNGISAPPGWSCTVASPISCVVNSLANGATATFLLNLTVDPTTPENTVLTLNAQVSTTSFDPTFTNNSSSVDVLVVRVADLEMTSYAGQPNPITPGQPITYNLRLTQRGPTPATNVTLVIPVPAQTTLTGFTPPAGWTCTTGTVISCTIPNLLNGVVTDFQYFVSVSPVATGTLSSTATVSSVTTDSPLSNNSATATIIIGPAVDLLITGSATPNPVTPGQTLSLLFLVSNNGPVADQNATFSVNTPPNTTFQSLNPPAGWICSTPPVGGTGAISCTASSVAVGGPFGFGLNVGVNPNAPNGTVNLLAGVQSSPIPDTNLLNNTVTVSYIVGPAADLRLTGTVAPGSVLPGQTAQYTINLSNLGPSDATNLSFSFGLPSVVTLVSFTPPPGWNCLAPTPGTTGTIVCTIGTFPIGSVTFVVQVQPATNKPQTTSATATANSSLPDPNLSQNSLTLLLDIGLPDEPKESADLIPQLHFVPDRTASTEFSNLLTYSFTVKNVGQATARAVSLRFPLPLGLAVGYGDFKDSRVWISEILTSELVILLPDIERDKVITGTLVFRPSSEAKLGEKVQLRYKVRFNDPKRVGREMLSNAVAFRWGEQNYNVSDGAIQLMTLEFREKIAYAKADFFIPNEIISLWLTNPDGNSVALSGQIGRADSLGEYVFSYDSQGLEAGNYTLAAYGARSEITGAAFFTLSEGGSKVTIATFSGSQFSCQRLKGCALHK